jgi:phosphoribulokinase
MLPGQRPLILGIVGDSAAGKTTLSAGVAAILGPGRTAVLHTDDYHRFSRAERIARGLTALHPDCNDLDLAEQHLRRLAAGDSIRKPVYNHVGGRLGSPQHLAAAPFVIVEGLLAFATPGLRACYDLMVYLNPEESLRRRWKIARDCARRGYSPAQAAAEIERRHPDAVEFIHPQRSWAGVVVRFGASAAETDRPDVRLLLRSTHGLPDLSPLIASQPGRPPMLSLRVGHDERGLCEMLTINGAIGARQAAGIAALIWAALPGRQAPPPVQLGDYLDGAAPRRSHSLGLVQLLVALFLLHQAA